MKNAHSCNADEGEELINQLNDLDPSFISIEVQQKLIARFEEAMTQSQALLTSYNEINEVRLNSQTQLGSLQEELELEKQKTPGLMNAGISQSVMQDRLAKSKLVMNK